MSTAYMAFRVYRIKKYLDKDWIKEYGNPREQ
jgi:hypothetical protein